MKVSYRMHPVLKMLETDLPSFKIDVRDSNYEKIGEALTNAWRQKRKIYGGQIDIISTQFANAAWQAFPKMFEAKLFVHLDWPLSGTMIFKNSAICYDCKRVPHNDGLATALEIVGFTYGDRLDAMFIDNKGYASKYFRDLSLTYDDAIKDMWTFVEAMLVFKKFAQVETKFLPANKKVTDVNCKYVNETKQNITYIDSTWFTNLVKSDAFKVRGHFRLQPCGEGLKEKKLIWINEFEKDGYTRKAKVLSH